MTRREGRDQVPPLTDPREAAAAGVGFPPLRSGEQRLSLGALIGYRLVILAVLLFIAGYLEAFQEIWLRPPVFWLISATFALSAVYAVMLGTAPYSVQATTQIVGDILAITGFVYLTGVHQAGFVALYPIAVLCGTVALGRGYVFAGLATMLYSALLLLIRVQAIPPEGLAEIALGPLRPLVSSVLILGIVCGSVAALGMYLARSLEKAGAQLDQAVERVSELEDLNRVIVENIPSGIVLTDANQVIVFANRASAEILGTDRSVLGPERDPGTSRLVADLLNEVANASEGETAREIQIQGADSTFKTVGLTISPLLSTGLVGGFLMMFRDLTEIRRLEDHARMNERLAAVGGAAAHLAHEIRNPLGAITTAARLLAEEGATDADRTTLASIIRAESERLNRTLTATLEGLREGPPVPASCALDASVRDFVEVLRLSPEKNRDHTVTLDIQSGGLWVAMSSEELKQVLWNLSKNALEAMPSGGKLSFSLVAEQEFAVLQLSDQGPGLDPRRLTNLFEPLQTTKALGTGLGLAIAHRMVRRRGGELSIRSRPGQGTTVRVALPMIPDSAAVTDGLPSRLHSDALAPLVSSDLSRA